MIYIHVIANVTRGGVQGYLLVRTLKDIKALDRFLNKRGKPVWIIMSPSETLSSGWLLGGLREMYWNSGRGYGSATMPHMPLL
jgi:hypothetical protein